MKRLAITAFPLLLACAALSAIVAFFADARGDVERRIHTAQVNAAYRDLCLPSLDARVMSYWQDGILYCKRITTWVRYGKKEPHVEVEVRPVIAMEDLE